MNANYCTWCPRSHVHFYKYAAYEHMVFRLDLSKNYDMNVTFWTLYFWIIW